MTISNFQYLILFATTFVIVGSLTPVVRNFALKKNVVDAPNSAHKTHKEPVPYLGGVAIITGIGLVSFIAFAVKLHSTKDFWLITSVMAPALALGVIGLIDDLKNLGAFSRFVGQTIAGIFTSIILIASDTMGTPTNSTLLDGLITTIWIVGICNSINFFDNLDGGAAGTVAVSSVALAYMAHNNGQFLITALATVTSGAMIGFLIWNRPPARIYMGDAGALFLGILVATLTIRLRPEAHTQWVSLSTPILLLAVPILDTSVAVISRLRRGVSPFQGGRDHLSHRLIRAGMERPLAAITLWVFSAFFALIACLISSLTAVMEQRLVALAGLIWLVLFIFFIRTQDA